MMKNIKQAFNRMLAILADLFISINVYSFLYTLGPYEILEKLLGSTWLLIFFNYVMFRIFFNLVLGISLSQYIFGLRPQGTFFWNRLGGAIRSIYEIPSIFLFPIAEFPILFGKRTLKEFFSQTTILSKNNRISIFGLFVFLPITFCLAIFSPLYETLFTKSPLVISKLSHLTQMESKPSISYNLEKAGLQTKSSLKNGQFVLIPSFKVTKRGNENKFRPEYIIYDKILKRKLSFYFEEGPEISSLLKIGKEFNPLFKIFYPEINNLEGKQVGSFSSQESEEIELLFENSLTVDPKKLFSYILNNGVFFRGAIFLKNEILRKIPADRIEKIKLGDKKFFCFKEFRDGKSIETFLPLFIDQTFLIKITHSNDFKFRNEFLSSFFYFSTWGLPTNKNSFYLTQGSSDYNNFAIERLLDLAKESLSLKDPLYQDLVLDNLDRFIFASQIKNGLSLDKKILHQLKGLKTNLLEKSIALKGL